MTGVTERSRLPPFTHGLTPARNMLAAWAGLLHGPSRSGSATGGSGGAAHPWPNSGDRVTPRAARTVLNQRPADSELGWVRVAEPRYRPSRAPFKGLWRAGPALTGGRHVFHTGLRSARERADRMSGSDVPRRLPPVRDRTNAPPGGWYDGPARASGPHRSPDRRAPTRKPFPALQGACSAASRGWGNATQPSAVPEFKFR